MLITEEKSLLSCLTTQMSTSEVGAFTSDRELLTDLFTVEEGDRVAQLIIEQIQTPEVMEVDVRLSSTF